MGQQSHLKFELRLIAYLEPAKTASIMFEHPLVFAIAMKALELMEMIAPSIFIRRDEKDNQIEHCHQSESLVEFRER